MREVETSALLGDRVLKPYPLQRVTILGMGQSLYSWVTMQHKLAGERIPHEEVWTVNSGGFTLKGDLNFDMHEMGWNPELDALIGGRRKRYAERNIQVVLPEADPNIESSYTYPLDLVVETINESYFDNGVCYMIAFAMLCLSLHPEPATNKELALYGVDYNYVAGKKVHGYEHGRCAVEYWLGRARALGLIITVPVQTTLMEAYKRASLSHRIYGYRRVPNFIATGGQLTLGALNDKSRDEKPDLSSLEQRDSLRCSNRDLSEAINKMVGTKPRSEIHGEVCELHDEPRSCEPGDPPLSTEDEEHPDAQDRANGGGRLAGLSVSETVLADGSAEPAGDAARGLLD